MSHSERDTKVDLILHKTLRDIISKSNGEQLSHETQTDIKNLCQWLQRELDLSNSLRNLEKTVEIEHRISALYDLLFLKKKEGGNDKEFTTEEDRLKTQFVEASKTPSLYIANKRESQVKNLVVNLLSVTLGGCIIGIAASLFVPVSLALTSILLGAFVGCIVASYVGMPDIVGRLGGNALSRSCFFNRNTSEISLAEKMEPGVLSDADDVGSMSLLSQ